jgi:ATP-dependent Clp protease, protease subunit
MLSLKNSFVSQIHCTLAISLFVVPFTFAQEEELFQPALNAATDSQLLDSSSQTKALAEKVKLLKLEKAKLTLEHEKKLLQFQQEKDRLELENKLHAASQTQLLAKLKWLKKRLVLENAVVKEQQKQIQASLEQDRDRLAMQNAILEEQNKQRELEFKAQLSELNFQKIQLEKQIAERTKRQEWESQVNTIPKYLKEPVVNGQLVISDRRIALNGPIIRGTADYIVDRIHYFNNKNSDYPIFLVIGYCRGGSVMEGSRILKAMRNSQAPVYVVVKSYAASMAAVITALAERSYAYPDAIIIHHQVWNTSKGNKTEQIERLKILDEWTERIISPVAEKMGLSLDEFIHQMYEQNSNGDWREFADAAVKYQWVDYVIENIRDSSFVKQPAVDELNPGALFLPKNHQNLTPQHHVTLPPLQPFDVYHLYNKDNYYRY